MLFDLADGIVAGLEAGALDAEELEEAEVIGEAVDALGDFFFGEI